MKNICRPQRQDLNNPKPTRTLRNKDKERQGSMRWGRAPEDHKPYKAKKSGKKTKAEKENKNKLTGDKSRPTSYQPFQAWIHRECEERTTWQQAQTKHQTWNKKPHNSTPQSTWKHKHTHTHTRTMSQKCFSQKRHHKYSGFRQLSVTSCSRLRKMPLSASHIREVVLDLSNTCCHTHTHTHTHCGSGPSQHP